MDLSKIDLNKLSPMMRQYIDSKNDAGDAILFFRLGDFYEMFFDDAVLVSKLLDLVLTGKDCGLSERAPMCGIPYHSSEEYVKKLVDMGYKVAIAEQLEDPKQTKGIVKREIVKIVTPSTIMPLESDNNYSNNFLCSVFLDKKNTSDYGVGFIDFSTGEVLATSVHGMTELYNQILSFNPSEFVINENCYNEHFASLSDIFQNKYNVISENDFSYKTGSTKRLKNDNKLAAKTLNKDYEYSNNFMQMMGMLKDNTTDETYVDKIGNDDTSKIYKDFDSTLSYEININDSISHFNEIIVENGLDPSDIRSKACLYGYLYICKTQKTFAGQINTIRFYKNNNFVIIDNDTKRNLELTQTMRTKDKIGSLLYILDKTKTAMGSRFLQRSIEQPLINKDEIIQRQDMIDSFLSEYINLLELMEYLDSIYDLERLLTRINLKTISPKELIAIKNSLSVLPHIENLLKAFPNSKLIDNLLSNFDNLSDIFELIDCAILEDAPFISREGNIIKDGYSKEVDEYRNISMHGKEMLAKLEEEEARKTGIKNLKIKYNRVFGYLFSVTNSQLSLVPNYFTRKQTISTEERFITDELSKLQDNILNSRDKLYVLEYVIFCNIRDEIAKNTLRIQKVANIIAQIDTIASLSFVARNNSYVRPEINDGGIIDIKEGRHPVIEKINKEQFISNDTYLDEDQNLISIITGPNMAGKSTYMRQVALITLMAHIGSFVPAASANISIVDRIFTRVGASDDLAQGKSTFMVEMSEVANIVKNATSKSLIILDEIGRGTATYDGMSIAQAVCEYISSVIKAKTLFATHYHELTELENKYNNIKNYNISVIEKDDDIIFLRKIIKGGADKSYGIAVAKLAGVPDEIINRSKSILNERLGNT